MADSSEFELDVKECVHNWMVFIAMLITFTFPFGNPLESYYYYNLNLENVSEVNGFFCVLACSYWIAILVYIYNIPDIINSLKIITNKRLQVWITVVIPYIFAAGIFIVGNRWPIIPTAKKIDGPKFTVPWHGEFRVNYMTFAFGFLPMILCMIALFVFVIFLILCTVLLIAMMDRFNTKNLFPTRYARSAQKRIN